jgi:N6-L-threonylcarbamoyladenine synthase
MLILGIESSCDETGLAIYCSERGLLAEALHSQIITHQKYGGVVPELASRDHIKMLIPLLDEVILKAKIKLNDLTAIAYTAGPGLIGALLTGACFAKSLAYSLNIKAIAVHHLEAHILVAKLESKTLDFPFITLLVSGGHTQLLLAESLGKYTLLGETLDDAVGEAFDKSAKLMGIPYPGGPELAKLADSASTKTYQEFKKFPRPMTDRPGLDFSFSGLKTHVLNCWVNCDKTISQKIGIAKSFQEAVVDTLIIKCKRALKDSDIKRLVVAGGVSANIYLREQLTNNLNPLDVEVYFPRVSLCTDNGVMIAYAGFLHLQNQEQDTDLAINVKAQWAL